jgi:hypothetical protein
MNRLGPPYSSLSGVIADSDFMAPQRAKISSKIMVQSVDPQGFNPQAHMPYGCTIDHIHAVMSDVVEFLDFVNAQLCTRGLPRLEGMLMPANFSSVVGEFVAANLPKYCKTLVKNRYHNGHPDLIPHGKFPGNAIQHTSEGIEIKASRYMRGWQGHNPEDCFLLVFMFECGRPTDVLQNKPLPPFRFCQVMGARLLHSDWQFSGRSQTSRRTITASVTRSGYAKMAANWIYKTPDYTAPNSRG